MPAKYTYQRLNDSRKEVRYLQILPGTSAVIQCRLDNATLETEHICLSHRWTGKAGTREIFINDKPFTISANLWHFLEIARRKYEPEERFWIDAICIDQQSISEKNKQVPLMGEIYSSAKLVVTWLGTGDPNTRFCVEAIRKRELRLDVNHFHRAVSEVDDFWADFWDHIVRFFENDYWKRAWVIQEVLLAADGYILIGDIEVTWSSLVDYWHLITRSNIAPQTHYKRLSDWNFRHNAETQAWRQQHESATLRTLLSRYGEQSCNDFHDRIYALLSLAKDRHRIRVDYNSSREKLFFDTLSACGTDKCFCLATCLLKILKLNSPRSTQYKPYRDGSWTWERLTTDNDPTPFISFGINASDILPLTNTFMPPNERDALWLRSLPPLWRRQRGGRIVRFLYTPVPAEFLLKTSSDGTLYIAAIRFHHGTTWTKHIESFYHHTSPAGITIHTYPNRTDLCCLRFSRSALLKLLLFGEQHTICERPSYGGYEIVGPDGILRCGKPIDRAWLQVEGRTKVPYRNPSTGSTPRPGTPNISPTLSRFNSGGGRTPQGTPKMALA